MNVESTETGYVVKNVVKDGPEGAPQNVQLTWDGASQGGRALVIVDGHVVDLHARGTLAKLDVAHHSINAPVAVESERAARRGSQQMNAARDRTINAPMPGRVVKLTVKVGDEVNEGATLCVVEAMKMENDVRSRVKGVVKEVHVVVGDTVESGAKLVTLG